MSVKRLNYFTHQFLREQDFKDEQNYHIEMRRRQNRLLLSWGVAEGLEIQKKDNQSVTVNPGTAIDKEGREIVLPYPVTRDLTSFNRNSETYVTIRYNESWDEGDHHATGGVEGYSRVTETPEILERKQLPRQDGAVITLARVQFNDVSYIHNIDMSPSVRKRASTGAANGWVRLAFKPVRWYPFRVGSDLIKPPGQQAEEYDFLVDEERTYSDEGVARGSMEIPVPPTATKVVGFRLAGTTESKVTVHLFRTGWNIHEQRGEKTELLNRSVSGPSFFIDAPIADGNLDETHTLAVSVEAERQSTIWLVAAKFE